MLQPFQTDLGSLVAALHEEFLAVCGDDRLATLATADLVNEMLLAGRVVLLQDDGVHSTLMEPTGEERVARGPASARDVVIVGDLPALAG